MPVKKNKNIIDWAYFRTVYVPLWYPTIGIQKKIPVYCREFAGFLAEAITT